MKKIVIIGGGLSGALTMLNICSLNMLDLEIILIEKNEHQLFKGLAYSSKLKHQPLNVPASGMSLYLSDPGHFYKWVTTTTNLSESAGIDITPDTFMPRNIFGQYLHSEISKTIKSTNNKIITIVDEVIGINTIGEMNCVQLQSGKTITADKIIIATGNQDTVIPYNINAALFKKGNIITNPWEDGIIESINKDATVMILGAGLTMIDLLVNLRNNNHRGEIYITSRRGLLPLPHRMGETWQLTALPINTELKSIINFVKYEVAAAKQKNIGWQSVIDAIRPYLPEWRKGLNLAERKSFMQHLKPYWEIHRHRIPESTNDFLQHELKNGNTTLFAGKLIEIKANEDNTADVAIALRDNKGNKNFKVNHIINCIGPLSNLQLSKQPLWQHLISEGIAATDYFKMGVTCNNLGQVIDKAGDVNQNIYVIGNLRKGTEFESVAIRELRLQAFEIAKSIVSTINKEEKKSLFNWIID